MRNRSRRVRSTLRPVIILNRPLQFPSQFPDNLDLTIKQIIDHLAYVLGAPLRRAGSPDSPSIPTHTQRGVPVSHCQRRPCGDRSPLCSPNITNVPTPTPSS